MVRRTIRLLGAFLALGLLACGASEEVVVTPTAPLAATAAGPSVRLEPRSGPPGTEVAVSGNGWPAGATVTVTAVEDQRQSAAPPYLTAVRSPEGAFSVRFRLEKTPSGADLGVGVLNLVARVDGTAVELPFLVEVRRPVGSGPGPGG